MKTLITTSALAALGIAAGANAGFLETTSWGAFSTHVASASSMTVTQGQLGYLPSNGNYSSVNGGSFGFALNIASTASNTLQVTTPNVLVAASSPAPQQITFSFPNNGTWAVRGFAFWYTAGGNVAVLVSVNGGSATNATLTSGNGFYGFVQDTNAGGDITSLAVTISGSDTFTITGSAFAVVPTPGAMALVAAAGLVTTRRRR